MNDLTIRPERPADERAVDALTRDAFWDVFRPGCVEHYILHQLRKHPDFIPELSLVAEQNGGIVGHIAYSRAAIVQENGTEFPLILFGPLSVRPDRQKSGVGAALIRHSLALAGELGYPAVAVCGWPDYYPRFGFQRARVFGITDAEGQSPDPLMALELQSGALAGVSGVLRESEAYFDTPPAAIDAFDATFPPRDKHVLPGQFL
ncbi:N-acetyltransferase [Agathobaculum sp. NTUH-O15-33]|uniref:GNAT family N-acetyltransferase n=1 Tax=Agathobaculum sp. NTUH-O15-33 TaxID=3079302 RepID=UPI0029589268|nr:N-acetyltransferase [Agathobaculum sp. NTUH-O15-33]WNX84177.1 N-acetyltransferase [Agathobaculum sp. NTUH-O15-33]